MRELLNTITAATIIFGLSFLGLAIGIIIRGKGIRHGCGCSSKVTKGSERKRQSPSKADPKTAQTHS